MSDNTETLLKEEQTTAETGQKAAKKRLKWWKIPLIIVLVIVVVAGAYVGYVFLTYSRIEDNKPLDVGGTAEKVAAIGTEYTIVSLNVGFGAYTADFTFFMDGGDHSRAESKESVLKCTDGCSDIALSYNPDFALFQEVDTDATRSYHVDQSARMQESFAAKGQYDSVFAMNYHSAYLMYPLTEPHGASDSGLLTLSRYNITSALRRSLPIATSVKKILDLDRCYSIVRIPTEDGKELVLINLHLSAYGTEAGQGNAQLQMLFEDMAKEYEKGNYVVCGGDFNHDFTGDSRETFNPGTDRDYAWCQDFPDDIIPAGFSKCTDYADGLVASTRDTDIPYCADSFTVTLDGFLISDNIRCTYVQVVDKGFEFTDHNPVVMKFILGGEKTSEP
ncbi:MAG: endonuclease/exonuclease/phosphatase family protein [Lachnospiraceae bacterium]|nr:endonuclease/exonuclease/phosphatase family protein [Lachnospiraceae bacterium]